MSALVINAEADQLFFLNTVELLAAVFHLPDGAGWAAIGETGLPALVVRASGRSTHCKATLDKLQAADFSSTASVDDLLAEQVRLFVAGRGGVVAPPYESCHQQGATAVMGEPAMAMRSRLAEAGLEVALGSNEPPDHLALELEYLHHCLTDAWSCEDPAKETEARAFAGAMSVWVKRFRSALLGGDAHPVFVLWADLAVAVLDDLAQAH